ncbi:MAG TPA: pyridoxamine 5'-phosphate oxidase family protein, partial [Acidimicrobiales bacterium]
MDTTEGQTWVEYIDADECWRLLAQEPVGRIGVLVDSAPEVYPVNHLVDGETIVFRTDPGTKLAGLAKSPAVCFQVDGIDPAAHRGWSVLVKGVADQVHEPEDRRRYAQAGLRYWTAGLKP